MYARQRSASAEIWLKYGLYAGVLVWHQDRAVTVVGELFGFLMDRSGHAC